MNYRCTRRKCRARFSFPKSRTDIPTCPKCGGHLAHDPAVRCATLLQKCTCDGLPYPHRKGTAYCIHGEVDYEDLRAHARRLIRQTRWV